MNSYPFFSTASNRSYNSLLFTDSPLHTAAFKGDLSAVESLMQRDVNIHEANEDGETPVHMATMQGHVQVLKMFLRDLDGEQTHYAIHHPVFLSKNSPLHLAGTNGHSKTILFLRKQGATLDAANYRGETPLHMIALSGKLEALKAFLVGLELSQVKALFEMRADDSTSEATPLEYAVRAGNTEVLRHLIELGINFFVKNQKGATLLHSAVSQSEKSVIALTKCLSAEEVIGMLNTTDDEGFTPLKRAIKIGCQKTCDYLLSHYPQLFLIDKKEVNSIELLRVSESLKRAGLNTDVLCHLAFDLSQFVKRTVPAKVNPPQKVASLSSRKRVIPDENTQQQNPNVLKKLHDEVEHELADAISGMSLNL